MMTKIREYVDDERKSLAEDAESEELADILGHNPLTGTRIALGLLFLNEVQEAQRWFANAAEEWLFKFQLSTEHRLKKSDSPQIDRFKWLDLIRGLQTGILSGKRRETDEIAKSVFSEIENPDIHDLSGLDAEPRIHAIGAMAAIMVGDPIEGHLNRLEDSLGNAERSHDWDLFEPQITLINGIRENDVQHVKSGLNALKEYHEEYSIGAGTKHFTEEAVDIYSCTYIVLARTRGLDIRVDSDYVPEGVYDEEHYPLAGE